MNSWDLRDSNPRPIGYEPTALTAELKSRYVPCRIRTCDLWLRRPTLYPSELWVHVFRNLKPVKLGLNRTVENDLGLKTSTAHRTAKTPATLEFEGFAPLIITSVPPLAELKHETMALFSNRLISSPSEIPQVSETPLTPGPLGFGLWRQLSGLLALEVSHVTTSTVLPWC